MEQGIEVTVTVERAGLDPFRGYANAIRDELRDAVAVLVDSHVMPLGSTALDEAPVAEPVLASFPIGRVSNGEPIAERCARRPRNQLSDGRE